MRVVKKGTVVKADPRTVRRHDVKAEGTAQRREDCPAAAEVLWPARLHACLQKKLPRLTVTAFAHLTLTDRHDTHRCRFFIADQG
ncbi:hypothetical protein [Pantoea sp. USHLN298]|uniref:hypothetical protein n=1 Tax=Pantoea sp. USHLN298 TaxID=3081294 RepID=UPI00301AD1FF